MGFVRKIGWLALLLGGCVGESSRVETVPEDLRKPRLVAPAVPDRHLFGDVTRLRPGQWASYKAGERRFTLAAVAQSGDALWIEVIDEGDPRQVSARLVGPDGVVRKAWFAEVGKDGKPSTVEAQILEQGGGALAKPAETGRETGEETVTVAGRELKAQKITLKYEDLEGRITKETTLWHKDVPPLYAGNETGGLVRRTSGTSTLELTGFGTDAKPLIEPPR